MKLRCKSCHDEWETRDRQCLKCGDVMEGVEGSEEKLVGESRSDGPASEPEKRSGERRGVGEIVERNELLRHLEGKISEARISYDAALHYRNPKGMTAAKAKETALVELYEWLTAPAAERSDLSNEQAHE